MSVLGTLANDPRLKPLLLGPGEKAPPRAITGLWGSSAPILAGIIANASRRPLLLVTAHLDAADDARDDIETSLGRSVDVFPAWEGLPGEGAGSGEIAAERTRLCVLLHNQSTNLRASDASPPILCSSIQALLQAVPAPTSLTANSLDFTVGQRSDPETIVAWLADRGFNRLDQVEEPRDFALRGGILDIFATPDADPLRLEFFDDRIESIRQFEIGSQRSTREMKTARVTLPPDAARLRPDETTTFLNYLPADTLVAFIEPVEIAEIGRTILDRLGTPVGYFTVESVFRNAARFSQLHLSRFPTATAEGEPIELHCTGLPTFEAKSENAVRQLLAIARDADTAVYCDNEGERERLKELIDAALAQQAPGTSPSLEIGVIHHGFRWQSADDETRSRDLVIIPHHELFRRYTQQRKIRKVATGRPIDSFIDLDEGDYVVHLAHGIGRYMGMRTIRKGDSKKSEEFLTVRFADDAVIHVPVSQIDLIQKYIGVGAARPTLSKLGGMRWQNTKEKVEEAVTDLAGDLLRLQAVRESQQGIAFPQDTHWQTEFENAFLYTETPDQITALADLKQDMTRARPMDRLLCGDVGYGKTELAMRAAFKSVEFGKQVAVLVPTTVLAEQHYRTFTERMAGYPFTIASLSRFRSPKEQKEIIAAARKGQIDVLIGTHRILSKDVAFSDLGLVVVDEEQRFGVEHKERLKFLRETVDVLTLTATPIPRTLHMAMVGLRDISSLATPPMDRRAISTRVCTWNDGMIREAILRELNRDGQVYFVHNRVRSIQNIAAKIAELVPDARLAVGHGQMPGDELEEVMARFVKREADILICTTIIEAGLDIPNANTMFIDRADIFGLADLHQLRGRIGRYKHRAYCYLMLSPDRPITSTAAKRLKAIEEFSDLGAGFRIAMRDLEIRGAGNILGPEQSGNIAAVGYELYCQLLEHTVKRMKGEPYSPRIAVHLELDVEAYIPSSYITSDRQRMECYRRFAACRTPEDVERLDKDMLDAFGRYGETVETLLTLTDIKVRAAQWGILTIQRREPDVIITFEGEVRKLEPLFKGATGKTGFPDAQTLYWRLPDNYFHGNTLLRILRNLFLRGSGASAVTDVPRLDTNDPQPVDVKVRRGRRTKPEVEAR